MLKIYENIKFGVYKVERSSHIRKITSGALFHLNLYLNWGWAGQYTFDNKPHKYNQ